VNSSAYWIAAARARESARPDRLFHDPYAAGLAGARGVAIMQASERASGGENPYLPVRTRWFDDVIGAALAVGVDQVVMLGAGLDTRPYRMSVPASVTWYEVDNADVLSEKDLGRAGCSRICVPADLRNGLGPVHAAGLDPRRPTLWVAEGLFFYLAAAEVDALLAATAAGSAPGSLLAADIIGASGLAQNLRARFYGHDDPAAVLVAAGWTPRTLTWAGNTDANFGRMRDLSGMSTRAPRSHLVVGVRAAIPGQPVT